MEVFKKLQQAKQKISETKLEKGGWNDYSKYKYFTPEQISKLVSEVSKELNLFNKFDLVRTDLGLMARLEIIDLDSGKRTSYEIATEIPEIKATNIAQQLGGCVTYSERYLLQIAYDIKDNNLDFDTPQKEKKQADKDEKPWLSEELKNSAVNALRANKPVKIGNLTFNDNRVIIDYIDSKYKIKKVYREELTEELNSKLND